MNSQSQNHYEDSEISDEEITDADLQQNLLAGLAQPNVIYKESDKEYSDELQARKKYEESMHNHNQDEDAMFEEQQRLIQHTPLQFYDTVVITLKSYKNVSIKFFLIQEVKNNQNRLISINLGPNGKRLLLIQRLPQSDVSQLT